MALKRYFIKTLLALIAVCAFIACTNPTDSNGGDTGGGNTPSVPEVQGYTVRFTAGEGGAITAKADGQNIVSGSKVKKDTLVTFTATPAGNAYVVGEWTIASPAVFKDGGEKGAMTAEVSVTGDVTIGVQFEQVTPLAPGQIRIMITGDGRTDLYKCYIDTEKNTTWGAIKTQIETKFTLLKTEWQGGDYGVYVWKLGSEKGTALTDGHPFTEGTTVYAVTNYIKFRMNGTVLEGYDGAEPRGRIIIPDTVTRIEEEAFKGCTGLRGLDFSACTELTEIGYGAFLSCTDLMGSLDLSACSQLTKIGDEAFSGCSSFTGELKLPANITEIAYGAFEDCWRFTGSLDLSACTKLTKIESLAFSGCKGFTGALKLSANITEIDYSAFSYCSGFTESLDLSACTKLTKIEGGAFRNCSGFTGELKLPVSLTGIGSDAFSGCTQAEVKLSQNITKIGSEAFGRTADVLYDMADSYCKKVKIPSGAQYKRIKALVKQSPYPEERIEAY
ncbi:leucine-rich repeat domain-containing protein [Treponema socranskii]